MSSPRKPRKQYDNEYKRQIVREYLKGEITTNALAEREGLERGQIYHWKVQVAEQARYARIEEIADTEGVSLDQARKIRELEEELEVLVEELVEVDVLVLKEVDEDELVLVDDDVLLEVLVLVEVEELVDVELLVLLLVEVVLVLVEVLELVLVEDEVELEVEVDEEVLEVVEEVVDSVFEVVEELVLEVVEEVVDSVAVVVEEEVDVEVEVLLLVDVEVEVEEEVLVELLVLVLVEVEVVVISAIPFKAMPPIAQTRASSGLGVQDIVVLPEAPDSVLPQPIILPVTIFHLDVCPAPTAFESLPPEVPELQLVSITKSSVVEPGATLSVCPAGESAPFDTKVPV